MRLYYTPESIGDLARLREFIASKNPESASRIAAELVAGIARLKDLPQLGRKVLKAPNPEAVRDLSVGMYIVRYLVRDNEIHILRIWHKREDWSNV
jgi:plasmid stabilization system protein ParE